MNAPAKAQKPDPDFYSNTGWMTRDIANTHELLGAKIKHLLDQNTAKTAVGQKLAAEEVARLAEQIKVCAEFLVRKSTEYVNRRPRP